MLIVMCGPPGAGKSAVAEAAARDLPAAVLSVDPVEAALWRAGIDRGQRTGLAAYSVVHALAGELLALGQPVLVDAVNDAPEARDAFRDLAAQHAAPLHFVEVRCPDEELHRRRLEGRRRDLQGFPEPSWESVRPRRDAFADWPQPRLVLDSRRPLHELSAELVQRVRAA
ncbi:putative kinase [Kineococcus xinjiangensis]|uniref:Putative kinase n=1 Tax=Kineococcus xinjiangensis TaxID=512762 RepID=A0A2S6IJ61_9ACTN|nr:ATP-binding protein [Kineococcus xinjiangensis]PPK94262.1 putative kinase [Kineococcus xinjiangensis]